VLDFVLVPANVSDGALAEQRLIGRRDLTVLGDKAYIDAPLPALLAHRNHLHLLPGPVDTDMIRDVALPKTSPREVVRAALDGVEAGTEDIFPDPMSQ
jgi:hypothetical protein